MLGQINDFAGKALLDHIFTDPAYSPPASLYIALCTATPTQGETGSTISEAAYTGYAREATAAADWSAASGNGEKTNTAAITFGQSSDSETEKAWALVDAAAAGDMIAWGLLATSVQSGMADAASDVIYLPSHGFTNGQKVVFDADSLPGGISLDTEYTVASATTDTFALSEVANITSGGEVIVGVSAWLAVANLVTPKFDVGQLTFKLF